MWTFTKEKTKKLTTLALLLTLALGLSYLESLLPSPGIPGVKPGLANISVIFVLYFFGLKAALPVSLLRVLIVNLLFGNPTAMLYGLSGAVLSLLLMAVLRKLPCFSPVGVSIAGGVAHNLGQILMAAFLMKTGALLYYLPVLILSGVLTGALIGFIGGILLKRLPKAIKYV